MCWMVADAFDWVVLTDSPLPELTPKLTVRA